MFCHGCGQEVAMGARFCSRCGRAVQFNASQGTWDGLVRPRVGRRIGGVCAGMAARYGWDLGLVRVITLLVGIFTFPLGAIAYVVMWIALPEEVLYLPVASSPTGTVDNAG